MPRRRATKIDRVHFGLLLEQQPNDRVIVLGRKFFTADTLHGDVQWRVALVVLDVHLCAGIAVIALRME